MPDTSATAISTGNRSNHFRYDDLGIMAEGDINIIVNSQGLVSQIVVSLTQSNVKSGGLFSRAINYISNNRTPFTQDTADWRAASLAGAINGALKASLHRESEEIPGVARRIINLKKPISFEELDEKIGSIGSKNNLDEQVGKQSLRALCVFVAGLKSKYPSTPGSMSVPDKDSVSNEEAILERQETIEAKNELKDSSAVSVETEPQIEAVGYTPPKNNEEDYKQAFKEAQGREIVSSPAPAALAVEESSVSNTPIAISAETAPVTSELPPIETMVETSAIASPPLEAAVQPLPDGGMPILPAVPFPPIAERNMSPEPLTPLKLEEQPRDRVAFQRLGRMVKSAVEVAVADLYSKSDSGKLVQEDALINTVLGMTRLNASTTLRTLDANDELAAAMLHIIHKSSPDKFAQPGQEADAAHAAQNRQLLQEYFRLVMLDTLKVCDVKEPLAQKSGEILSRFSAIGAGIQDPQTPEGKLAGERATVMLAKAFDKAAEIACEVTRTEREKTERPPTAVSRLNQRTNGNGVSAQSAARI